MEIKDPAHQARERPLTPYEDSLAEGLERILDQRRHELTDIVAGLNEIGLKTAEGGAWTQASFIEEMKRLGS